MCPHIEHKPHFMIAFRCCSYSSELLIISFKNIIFHLIQIQFPLAQYFNRNSNS